MRTVSLQESKHTFGRCNQLKSETHEAHKNSIFVRLSLWYLSLGLRLEYRSECIGSTGFGV